MDPCPVNKSPTPQGRSYLTACVWMPTIQGSTGQSHQIIVCATAGVHLLLWRIGANRRDPKRTPDLSKGFVWNPNTCVCVCVFVCLTVWCRVAGHVPRGCTTGYMTSCAVTSWALEHSPEYWVTDEKHGRQCSYVGNAMSGRLTRTDHWQVNITFLQVTSTSTGARRSRWHHVQRAVRYVTSSLGARQTAEHSEQRAVNLFVGPVSI